MTTRRAAAQPVLADPISADLKQVLRTLKLGKLLDTLPERLTLARQQQLPHADFLELVLADEVTRRDTNSAALRAHAAGLDPAMRLESWDTTAAVRFDQQLWNELTSLRFLDGPHGALLLGPVGVGKTHLATALGHVAVRRRVGVHMTRAAPSGRPCPSTHEPASWRGWPQRDRQQQRRWSGRSRCPAGYRPGRYQSHQDRTRASSLPTRG